MPIDRFNKAIGKTTQIISKNDSYITLKDSKTDLSSYNAVVNKFEAVQRSKAANNNEVVTDVSVRAPFGRSDYEFFHPNEYLPRDFRQIILACRASYMYVGVIRNVIDLMTDFACEDLCLIHTDPKVQAFFKVWSKKVNLFDVAQEFVRHFLVDGNVVIKRITTKLTVPLKRQWESAAKVDQKSYVEKSSLEPGEIPIRYIHLNLLNLLWIGGIAAKIADKQFLTFNVNPNILSVLRANKEQAKEILDALPLDIREHILNKGPTNIPLDMSKIFVSYNKKDSWEPWATPYLISILKDVKFRDKLRQAEISTLDGFISTIRLWKLGDHKEGFLPNDKVIDKLVNMISSNVGGGSFDIVWDSMIDMEEFYPPVELLGSEKYDQVNKDILIGLGVPDVLLGGKGANFSNSFIQLKTLVEKLKTVRSKVIDWINTETAIVCRGMGFDSQPRVKFNYNNLQDDSVKQKLIMGLLDRGLISADSVLQLFNEDWDMEVERISEQQKTIKQNKLDVRNPLPDPKIMQQQVDQRGQKMNQPNISGQPKNDNGRPNFQKDDTKRDQKVTKVKTKSSIAIIKAMDIIDLIDDNIVPVYMDHLGVDNARKLTNDQKREIDNIRLVVLSSIKIADKVDSDFIIKVAENTSNSVNKNIVIEADRLNSEFLEENGEKPTLSQRKRLNAIAWANFQFNDGE